MIDNLLSFYKNPRENGIFFSMYNSEYFVSLMNDIGIITEEDAHAIDMDYMYNNSGFKTVSCLLENFINGYVVDSDGDCVIIRNKKKVSWDYIVTNVDRDIINFVLKTRYLHKWQQLFINANSEFDALSPFHIDYEESRIGDLTSRGTSKNKQDTTSESADSLTSVDDSLISGFNSVEPVNTDQNNKTSSSSGNASSSTSQDKSNDYTRIDTSSRTYLRKGNIGNQTQSDLLIKQREYLQFVLLKQIYIDLDEVLTRSKYY